MNEWDDGAHMTLQDILFQSVMIQPEHVCVCICSQILFWQFGGHFKPQKGRH